MFLIANGNNSKNIQNNINNSRKNVQHFSACCEDSNMLTFYLFGLCVVLEKVGNSRMDMGFGLDFCPQVTLRVSTLH